MGLALPNPPSGLLIDSIARAWSAWRSMPIRSRPASSRPEVADLRKVAARTAASRGVSRHFFADADIELRLRSRLGDLDARMASSRIGTLVRAEYPLRPANCLAKI